MSVPVVYYFVSVNTTPNKWFCGVEFLLLFAALNLAAWFRACVCVALAVFAFCVHEKQ